MNRGNSTPLRQRIASALLVTAMAALVSACNGYNTHHMANSSPSASGQTMSPAMSKPMGKSMSGGGGSGSGGSY